MEGRVLTALRKEAANADAMIVLDQIDHLITAELLRELPGIARRSGCLLHGSSRERIGLFKNFDLITPNDRETQAAVGGEQGDLVSMGRELKKVGSN